MSVEKASIHCNSQSLKTGKNVFDKKCFGGAILMDLSKVFDTIKHDLLITKLDAYGFNKV